MSDQLFSVENKICIVTGGLGQIGKNFVQELWKRGARVARVGPHRQRRAPSPRPWGEEALRPPLCVFTLWTSLRRRR